MTRSRSLFLAAAAVLAVAAVGLPAPRPKGDAGLWRDDFDGKLTLDWKVVRPDPTHVSLKKCRAAW